MSRIPSLRIIATVAVGLLLLTGSSCSHKGGDKTEKDDSVPVELAAVVDTSISSYISAAGNLEPEKAADVLAKVEGTILSIEAEEGDLVREGEVLATLDGSELHLNQEQARIRAEAQEVEYDRAKALHARGLLSDQDFNQRANDCQLAKSELEAASLRYSYCTIRAPFDGRVTSRNVDLGQTVRIGTPLFRVEDTSPLLCKIYLPSNLVSSIAEGQAAEIVAKGLSDSTLTGRVRMISPIVDPMTGTVKVTVEVDGSGNPVRSGSFVEVRMITDIHNGVPAVPKKAILSEGGELYVFAAGSDTVRRVRVTTGYEQDDLVEVVSGLHSGDSVVVVGHGGIEEGTKIKAMKGPGSASSAADSALADSLSGGTAPGVGGAPADSVAQSSISDSEQNQGDTQ